MRDLHNGLIYPSQHNSKMSLGAGTDGQHFLLGPTDVLEATDDQYTRGSQRFHRLVPQVSALLVTSDYQ
jgi:hypothetical protein